MPVCPGKCNSRSGAARPSAKTSAMLGDTQGLQSGLLPRRTLVAVGTDG